MKRIYPAALLVVTLAFAPAPFAKERVERPLTAETRTLFDDQAAAIRQQMQPGGHYEFVSTAERAEVEQNLDRIAAALAQHPDVTTFSDADKAALLQAQENVNAVLTRNDGRRLICQRERSTGSHLGKDKCQTFAERERARRSSESEVRRLQMKAPTSSGLPNAADLRRGGGN
ncbi:MAG TPA: hypothetical protein VLF18_20455 [Tahibacter sp.]|uniref:hypothetical protein n=1 Tax=Tahibacter sp. TaxID=2056211 RepID=UPI002CB07425|nr:hypothetical protein [Tahibacter sp.]HSX62562.1 hypothetical protein [Tahibacter sp.]